MGQAPSNTEHDHRSPTASAQEALNQVIPLDGPHVTFIRIMARILAATAAGYAVWFVVSGTFDHTRITILALGAFCVATLVALRYHHNRAAIQFFLWGCTILATYHALVVNGLNTPVVLSLPVLVIIASLLLDRRSALSMLGFMMAGLTLAWAIHTFHWLPSTTRSPNEHLVAALGITVIAALLGERTRASLIQRIRKILELRDEIEKKHASVLLAEQKFAAAFRLNPQPVALIDLKSGDIQASNAAYGSLFGHRAPWQQAETGQSWISQLAAGQNIAPTQLTLKAREGLRHCLVSAAAVSEDEQRVGLLMITDITERVTAEQAQKDLNQELARRVAERTEELVRTRNELVQAEKLAALGQMVAGVSHELNTPIGTALTTTTAVGEAANQFALDLEVGGIKKSALTDFVARVQQGSQLVERNLLRSAELIAQFKQVAANQLSEQKQRIDLKKSIDQLLAAYTPQFAGHPWQFDNKVPADLVIETFPGALQQVILAIADNAVRHGFSNRQAGRFCLDAEVDGTGLTLRLSDDGNGMPPQALASAFDPFFTTQLGQGGTGVGLTVAHRLVTRLLGGHIRLEPGQKGGTLVTVRLPLHAPEVI